MENEMMCSLASVSVKYNFKRPDTMKYTCLDGSIFTDDHLPLSEVLLRKKRFNKRQLVIG